MNNIFDYLNTIFLKTGKISKDEFDIKICPKVLLIHWLSMEKDLIKFVNNINKDLWWISDWGVYAYFYDIIPKKRRFIKFIKKTKDEKRSKFPQDLILKHHLTQNEITYFERNI